MAQETLYISGAGDECNISDQSGCYACPDHYTCVDESPGHDGTGSYVYAMATAWQRDLYAVANHSVGLGVINWVRVYAVMRVPTEPQSYGKLSIKSGGVAADSVAKALTTSWVAHYEQWATNPATSAAWGSDWSVIDALQAGITLYGVGGKEPVVAQCTQVYVVVDYTYRWLGKISGVTNPGKIMGVARTAIKEVKGVAGV